MKSNPQTRCPVVFEDEELLIINKPEGVLSHPNPGNKNQSAAFEGAYDFSERRFDAPAGRLWLIHRLDQDTSGILLAAKTPKSAAICRDYFEKKDVKKDYLALVSRKPMPAQGKWRDTLIEKHAPGSVRVMISRSGAPNSFLSYKMREFFPKWNLALLEIQLLTGKTHQIRVQSVYHGHPVAGDRVYGNFGLNKELRQKIGLRRLFLHAWRLTFKHPVSGQLLEIESLLPEDLEECLAVASRFKR